MKQNVRSIPAAGRSGSTGLRQRVARGVRVQQTGRAALRVVATMARPDEESLPLGLDSPSGWRHPVFGHRDRWVTQRTRGSWFRDEIAAGGDEVQRRLHAALERAAQTIAAAGSG
ncbi:hypothetical protein ACH4FX_12485 [Streptomyces sp. NPDC018019]|uniref:hypothetical protein n=1 Tax=Streptomyces sp. NPDC018019 TaxID=3365030 RepID=UPI0037B15BD9